MVRIGTLLAALGGLLALSASGAPGSTGAQLVRLTSTPALFPAYAPSVHDYVVRCAGSSTVKVTTWAAAGTVATIDGVRRSTATLPLRPGQAVTVAAANGAAGSDYVIRCLPADFPAFDVAGTSAPGWTIATPSLASGSGTTSHYVVILDGDGVPVWWYRDAGTPLDARLLSGSQIAWAELNAPSPAYQVRTLAGKLVRRLTSPDGQIDDHELQETANGDDVYLVYQPKQHVDLTALGGPADATVLEGQIEEQSPAGKVVWSWSTDGHIGVGESADWAGPILKAPVKSAGEEAYDVYHANSVSLQGNLVVLSLRYEDAIYGIDKTTGAILWKLGGTPTPESLTVTGDPFGAQPFSGQHDARIQPDGTLTVFDDETQTPHPPRTVHYAIDTTAHTATYLGGVSDPDISASACCGSARLLAGGDWVVSWGGDPVIGTYAPDGTPLRRVTFPGLFSYRAVPVASGRLTAARLRAAMDAMAPR